MFTAIKNCFSPETINTGRQPELDMAKGFAIIFMVWTHVLLELSPRSEGIWETLANNIFGGPFAAPVFMICMGIGISYSRKNTPKDLLRRGFSLLGIGLLLNAFRYVLPDLIKYSLTQNNTYLKDTIIFFSVDILQFAGLTFLFLAFAKKMRLNNITLLLVGIIASLLGASLRSISTGNAVTDLVAGFFWGAYKNAWFPFLNWIIFPIAGLIFGSLIKHCKDKSRFYLLVSPVCGVLMIVYLILTIRYGFLFSSNGSYFLLGPLDALFFIILALGLFGFNYAILQVFSKCSFNSLMRMSKNVNNIYCIHWTLIGIIGIFPPFLQKTAALPFWLATLIAVLIVALSDRMAVLYLENIKPNLMTRNKKHMD